MKSTFLKAIKTVALSLVLMLGASSLVFANGAGSPTATKVALNGGGNGAGGSTSRKKWRKTKRTARRHGKAKSKTA